MDPLARTDAPPRFAALPLAARLFLGALRSGLVELRHRPPAWEESEVLALCDAAGLRRCGAARLGACVAFLLREGQAGHRDALAAPGCPCLTAPEVVLAAALAGPAGPMLAARRVVAGWLPPRRRMSGLVLLDLAAQDLAAWAAARAGGPDRGGC